ncbi:NUDIX domain-containing protein [Dactylosporangium sp. NPDC000555]|uniref:NUDIX hydrolase n=1 Tax=Dactylosporangium sp. NPDC000555 TaxID=3154260 RepID=UPI00331DBDC0
MTEAAADIDRRAARVLLLDPSGRVLLLRGCDPARPEHRYWFTVGGGVEADESLIETAVREVYEETGLRITPADLVGPVRTDQVEFPFDGRWYSQQQSFFVVRADAFTVDLTNLADYEVDSVDATRWWAAGELDATSERFYPSDLADLLREVG